MTDMLNNGMTDEMPKMPPIQDVQDHPDYHVPITEFNKGRPSKPPASLEPGTTDTGASKKSKENFRGYNS